MTPPTDAIREFWTLFRQRASALVAESSADGAVYNELLAQLQRVDPGLYLEFCAHPGECELIVTPHGKRSLFDLARAVVEAAPEIEGWTMRALKPKLGFPVTAQWDTATVTLASVVFKALARKGSDDLYLRMFVPGLDEENRIAVHNALLGAIDHGLGEEKFAESVDSTELRKLPEDADPSDYIPLLELEAFLEWRAKKKREQH
jgi:hypothetical protein